MTYKSQGLARELDLENLYISFNGYWPEKHASLPTCSFKDLEAAPTMQMLLDKGEGHHWWWPQQETPPVHLPI